MKVEKTIRKRGPMIALCVKIPNYELSEILAYAEARGLEVLEEIDLHKAGLGKKN